MLDIPCMEAVRACLKPSRGVCQCLSSRPGTRTSDHLLTISAVGIDAFGTNPVDAGELPVDKSRPLCQFLVEAREFPSCRLRRFVPLDLEAHLGRRLQIGLHLDGEEL